MNGREGLMPTILLTVIFQFSDKALGYGLGGPGSIPGVGGIKIFLHSLVSTLVLGSTQPRIKWVPGGLSPGVKKVERRTSHSTSS